MSKILSTVKYIATGMWFATVAFIKRMYYNTPRYCDDLDMDYLHQETPVCNFITGKDNE